MLEQERVASLHRMLSAWDGWVSIGMLVAESEYASAAAAGLDHLRHDGQPVPAPERVALSLIQVGDWPSRGPGSAPATSAPLPSP
jgi:hypothetical protein